LEGKRLNELKVGDIIRFDGSVFKVTKIVDGIPHLNEIKVEVALT